jgi:hypothetical protein
MRLKVVLTKGRRATEVGFSGVVAALFGGHRARPICRSPYKTWNLLSLGLFIPDDGGSTYL